VVAVQSRGRQRAVAQWLTEALTAAETGTALHFVTLDATTGRAIGSTSYCTPRPDHGGLEIGWTWLTPSAWRTGANAEAKLLQLTHAFERLGCHRVEFHTDERNERSRRALMALPAHFEGVLRDWKVLPTGRWRRSYTQELWMRLKRKAAYLPG